MFYEYIDHLPKHPSLTPEAVEPPENTWINPNYKIFYTEPVVARWLRYVFEDYDSSVTAFMYQCLEADVHRHIDDDRDYCYNLILDPGGAGVWTRWWDGDNLIHQAVLEPNRWHRFNTSIAHSVEGITGRRVAVTVFPGVANP